MFSASHLPNALRVVRAGALMSNRTDNFRASTPSLLPASCAIITPVPPGSAGLPIPLSNAQRRYGTPSAANWPHTVDRQPHSLSIVVSDLTHELESPYHAALI
ncbi:hypothetical protein MN608_00583 [Microdochium nivale]|nr:hypothetical protein MN608_00583 [Microdochium nivale]